jgi:ribosome modulation factor
MSDNLPATILPPKMGAISHNRVKALVPATLEDAFRMGKAIFESGVAPYGLKNPNAVSVVIMAGMEIGLPPMQAMQSIMVVNNKPAIYGDAAIALVRQSGLLHSMTERIEGEGDAMVAVCQVARKGGDGEAVEVVEERFSVEDAKLAGLWTKKGPNGSATPWQTYPKRMLKFRARGFALRDLFADVLKGMRTVEEEQDHERMESADLTPPPPPPPPPAPSQISGPVEVAAAEEEKVEWVDESPGDEGGSVVEAAQEESNDDFIMRMELAFATGKAAAISGHPRHPAPPFDTDNDARERWVTGWDKGREHEANRIAAEAETQAAAQKAMADMKARKAEVDKAAVGLTPPAPPAPPPAPSKTPLARSIEEINAAPNLLALSKVYDKWGPLLDDWTRRDISIFEAAYQTKQAQF